jgi:hypothetical protein
MNHREIRQSIQVARGALKAYYAAADEVDWALENINWNSSAERADNIPRRVQKNEVTLRSQSKLAHNIMMHTLSLAQNIWSHLGSTSLQSFYMKNREQLSNSLLDALEKTLED